MRVHAFKVEWNAPTAPPEDILKDVKDTQLKDRNRTISDNEVRIEKIEKSDKYNIWYIDFVKKRTKSGPGRVGSSTPIEGFDFQEGQGFGEETAALYDPATGHMIIQYNHNGVRSVDIERYLSFFHHDANNSYALKAVFDEDVERRLIRQGITKKLIFTIDISKMSAKDRAKGTALSDAITFGNSYGVNLLSITMSAGLKKESKLFQSISNCVSFLRGVSGTTPEAVKKLEVTGKKRIDADSEVLDLLGQRLYLEYTDLTVGPDLRYPYLQRWNALLRAKNTWKDRLRI